MINSSLLKKQIARTGLKYSFIANQLTISTQSFYNKLNNLTEFTIGQVFVLTQLLDLDEKAVKDIFFTNNIT